MNTIRPSIMLRPCKVQSRSGLETADELLTQPSELRKRYLEALRKFNDRFQEICHRNRVERVVVDTSRDRAEVLIDHLNQRSLLNRGR